MANNANNVTTGKPRVGGGVWVAPLGTVLPTDATTALNAAFKPLGYVSEDGLTNADSIETETIRAWGGDTVATPETGRTDTFGLTLLEILNVDVLKFVYGPDNVTGTSLDTGITVKADSGEHPAVALVFEMILRGNVLKRIVVPNGTITQREDVVYVDNDVTGYGVTINAAPASTGVTHYEYLKTATAAE